VQQSPEQQVRQQPEHHSAPEQQEARLLPEQTERLFLAPRLAQPQQAPLRLARVQRSARRKRRRARFGLRRGGFPRLAGGRSL
jgi:hypothetical protein